MTKNNLFLFRKGLTSSFHENLLYSIKHVYDDGGGYAHPFQAPDQIHQNERDDILTAF